MKKLANLIKFLLILIISTVSAQRKCLKDLTIAELNPGRFRFEWNYDCPLLRRGVKYKIYYEHIKWKACSGDVAKYKDPNRSPAGRGVLETDSPFIVMDGVHPYSMYKVNVKAIPPFNRLNPLRPEEKEIVVETPPSKPGVRPLRNHEKSPVVDVDSLRFYWSPPDFGNCSNFNTDLDGFYYEFSQEDSAEKIISKTTRDNSAQFKELRPYTNYKIVVYSYSVEGKYDAYNGLRLDGRTSPGLPLAPFNLRVITNTGDSRILAWEPGTPLTGEPYLYSVRLWTTAEGNTQIAGERTVDFAPGSYPCPDTVLESNAVCGFISGLDPLKNYTISVSTFNRGINDRSRWSEAIVSKSPPVKSAVSETVIIAVAAIVAVVLIILIFACVMLKFINFKKSQNYKNVPQYDTNTFQLQSRQGSIIKAGTVDRKYANHLLPSQTSQRPSSIQETPLPPVPPEENVYDELDVIRRESKNFPMIDESIDLEQSQPLNGGGNSKAKQSPINSPSSNPPPIGEEGEDEYLTPRKRNLSSDTLDQDDYLKPTFNRISEAMINPRDLSPPTEKPPPIPIVSYGPK